MFEYFLFFFLMKRRPPKSTLFPYPTLSRSDELVGDRRVHGALRPAPAGELGGLVEQLVQLGVLLEVRGLEDRKSTRLNSSHANISYAVFCLKKKKNHAV